MDEKTIGILIGAGVTLAGVVLTGYLNQRNISKQVKFQQAKDERLRKLEKLEDLHQLVSDYTISANAYVSGILIAGRSSDVARYPEVFDKLLHPLPTISSKLKIYAPGNDKPWEELASDAARLFEMGANYLQSRIKDDRELQSQHQKLNRDCQILLKFIEDVIQRETKLVDF